MGNKSRKWTLLKNARYGALLRFARDETIISMASAGTLHTELTCTLTTGLRDDDTQSHSPCGERLALREVQGLLNDRTALIELETGFDQPSFLGIQHSRVQTDTTVNF